MTEGAGIAKEEISKRIVASTDKDLRYYLMQYIISHPEVNATKMDNWKFIPEEIVEPAIARDRKLLFND